MEIWKPVSIPLDQWHAAAVGPLSIRLRRWNDEWHMVTELLGENEHSEDMQPFTPCDPPETNDWRRWVINDRADQVKLTPVMPDNPIVVRPDFKLNIPGGSRALFFVSIPIWVRVIVQDEKAITLCEEPTLILSHTWFGETTSGEFCYALPSRARRKIDEAARHPYRAVSPVMLINAGTDQLAFERLCVRVERLTIYQGERHLWTNQVNVVSKAKDEPNVMTFDKKAPAGVSAANETIDEVLSEPRKPDSKSFLQKSVGAFRMFGL